VNSAGDIYESPHLRRAQYANVPGEIENVVLAEEVDRVGEDVADQCNVFDFELRPAKECNRARAGCALRSDIKCTCFQYRAAGVPVVDITERQCLVADLD
jgi:hypothetical protein